jgi:hypothetical protein
MRRFTAFLTRLVVFVILGYVQHVIISDNQILQQLDTRIIVSSLQIFLVGCVLALYFICRWIFEIMHINAPYKNIHMSTDDSPSLHGETASQVSQGLVAQQVVIFADRDALSRHVMRVYVVGFMLHATVFCINYTTTGLLFQTSTGAVLGYLTRALHFTRHTTLTLLFACMFASLVVLTYIDLAARDDMVYEFRDAVTGVVMPILVGFAWTSGLCFGDKNRYCVEMSTEAFPVCCLCVVPVMWATPFATWTTTFAQFDAFSLILLLLVEPIAKFMSIYVLMISLQTQNVLDTVLVLCAVAQAELLVDEFLPFTVNWNATTRLILMSLLLVMRTAYYCYDDITQMCIAESHHFSSPGDPFVDEGKCAPASELDEAQER